MAQSKKVEVKILKPVSGTFRLSASPGDAVKVEKEQADEMIAAGFAIAVEK